MADAPETSWTQEDDDWQDLDWWEDGDDESLFSDEVIPFCDLENPSYCESCQ